MRSIIASIKGYLETDKLAGINEIFVRRTSSQDNYIRHKDRKGLIGIKKAAEACKACPLYKKRTHMVFGSGSPHAGLMFVGEAPGADEDLQGLPFVGRAGQLLTKMIEAIGMRREDVYIANVLKCRPPGNRCPLPDEIEACSHFLLEQIESIHPKVVCCLGKFASQFLLNSATPISALRGRFYEMDDIKVMPTFHPAYLLRNPGDKRLVWEDLKKIRHALRASE
ncbi:MAG: uracil-DNA glycosylase [Candidatus Omnitrophica bacterium]|nr:uracil-DNA glycosylase [Candidatus Omnitrophota bacterium]